MIKNHEEKSFNGKSYCIQETVNGKKQIRLIGMSTLAELNGICSLEFPGQSFDNLIIETAHEQFQCFGYDLYDSSDYETCIYISPL